MKPKLSKADRDHIMMMCAQGKTNEEIRKWLHDNLHETLSNQTLSLYRREPEVETMYQAALQEFRRVGFANLLVRAGYLEEACMGLRNALHRGTVTEVDGEGAERERAISPNERARLSEALARVEKEFSRLVDGSSDDQSMLDKPVVAAPALTPGQIENIRTYLVVEYQQHLKAFLLAKQQRQLEAQAQVIDVE